MSGETIPKMDIWDYVVDGRLKISVKVNAPKTQLTGYDQTKKALKLDVKAQPEKGKANKELIKFFTKLLKKKVAITHGLVSKQKVLKIS